MWKAEIVEPLHCQSKVLCGMAYWQGLSFCEHPPQNCSKSLLVPVNLEFWKLWTFLYILLLDISWTILHWTPANDPKIGQKEKLGKTCASQPQVSGFLHFASHRFSAFWLRSKCSICSYQLNIWYENHVFSSILNWFLAGDEVSVACYGFVACRPCIAVPQGFWHTSPTAIRSYW